MFEKKGSGESGGRPPLSTIRSDDDLNQSASKPVKRAETASASRAQSSKSLRRKESSRPSMVNRSETMSSKRPLVRMPSIQTRYMEMLLHLDEIPRLYNILASLSTWIILAGFLVVPGTFTTFKESKAFQDADKNHKDEITHAILNSIANIGLLWLSGSFCVAGIVGCIGLWIRWRENYVWLINRIFLPVTMNSVAGLLTTLVNVYTAQHGVWSITARVTAIVIGSCLIIAGLLFVCHNFWALRRVRKVHEREVGLTAEREDETLVEKVKRKVQEPPIQPGGVV